MEDKANPFPSTFIDDWTFLDSSAERSICPMCRKSRKYYCYSCLIALPHLVDRIPKVQLPVSVDIIKHPNETDGKSTSCHAAVLAPDDVRVFTYPCIPDYDPQRTVLVFPSEDAVSLESLRDNLKVKDVSASMQAKPLTNSSAFTTTHKSTSQDGNSSKSGESDNTGDSRQTREVMGRKRGHTENADIKNLNDSPPRQAKQEKLCLGIPFDKVVLIDSTWNQTQSIACDERLKNITKVELKSQNTNFWRRQEGIPKYYLSTIEAIYYFMKDVHTIFSGTDYAHEYDNLLFFFCFMYNKIQASQKNVKKKKNGSGSHTDANC